MDLDGTLIRTDLSLESLLHLLARKPLLLFMLPLWLLRGPAALRAEVAARVELDPATLPYDIALLNWLRTERAGGRELWLCTGPNEPLAARVAGHLGLFAGLLAGGPGQNLADFEYYGKEHAVPAAGDGGHWRAYAHQWAKNKLLILVPLLTSHRAGNPAAVSTTLLAVLEAFSLCATAGYVLHDLLDLEADRNHPRKASRPFAAGDASIASGLALVPALLGAAVLVATLLPVNFRLVLATYFVLTLAYSLNLKRRVLIDAMALAALYTLRIIAGATATSIALSFWLLLFSVFLFLGRGVSPDATPNWMTCAGNIAYAHRAVAIRPMTFRSCSGHGHSFRVSVRAGAGAVHQFP